MASASSAEARATKFRRTSAASGSADCRRAGLYQHDRRSPQRQVVAKCPYLELVVVAPDLTRGKRFQRIPDDGTQLLGEHAALVLAARLIVGDGQERNGRRFGRIADGSAPALVVQVESDRRAQAVAHVFQHLTLGCLQPQSVTVDVDALRVAAFEPLCTVRVQHRDDVQRERGEHSCHRRLAAMAS